MAIDPKILAQMRPPDADSSDYDVCESTPEAPLPVDRHPGCAPFTGAWKQRKWAIDLRNGTLALAWPPETLALLKSITDSTWWIANKAIVHTMKFKPPSPPQTNGSVAVDNINAPLDADVSERQNRQARDEQARVSDAERWAKSVSQHPKLAEAAILAVLSRLYVGSMKARLRLAAKNALNQAEHVVDKDTDAINRMLA